MCPPASWAGHHAQRSPRGASRREGTSCLWAGASAHALSPRCGHTRYMQVRGGEALHLHPRVRLGCLNTVRGARHVMLWQVSVGIKLLDLTVRSETDIYWKLI